jgi:hypothetical protein
LIFTEDNAEKAIKYFTAILEKPPSGGFLWLGFRGLFLKSYFIKTWLAELCHQQQSDCRETFSKEKTYEKTNLFDLLYFFVLMRL